jgi:lipoprotein-anchoring transpeptidase ErfK/SrfK
MHAATTVGTRALARLILIGLLALALLTATGLGDAAEAATVSEVREAQILLNQLGYPAGVVDGVDGAQTRRGLCAWRRLEGRTASRGPRTTTEQKALRKSERLPAATAGRGVTVDKTCQTVYYRDGGRWQKVLKASTGSGGLPRVASYKVERTWAGWHTSSKYPSSSPNMYNTLYFSGSIAIHGSKQVPTYPASHGCVRVTTKGADYLFARLRVGDPVRVIGSF